MEQNAILIFKPLLAYLSAEGELVGIAEIFQHLAKHLLIDENSLLLFDCCNWLVDIGILQVFENPVKLTPKSRITVSEPAYFFEGDEQ